MKRKNFTIILHLHREAASITTHNSQNKNISRKLEILKHKHLIHHSLKTLISNHDFGTNRYNCVFSYTIIQVKCRRRIHLAEMLIPIASAASRRGSGGLLLVDVISAVTLSLEDLEC